MRTNSLNRMAPLAGWRGLSLGPRHGSPSWTQPARHRFTRSISQHGCSPPTKRMWCWLAAHSRRGRATIACSRNSAGYPVPAATRWMHAQTGWCSVKGRPSWRCAGCHSPWPMPTPSLGWCVVGDTPATAAAPPRAHPRRRGSGWPWYAPINTANSIRSTPSMWRPTAPARA